MDLDIRFETFLTRDDRFYVYCSNNLVACIAKVAGGWMPMANGAVKKVYRTALMAAFADANMSDATNWQ